jgi:hypothetical protein
MDAPGNQCWQRHRCREAARQDRWLRSDIPVAELVRLGLQLPVAGDFQGRKVL